MNSDGYVDTQFTDNESDNESDNDSEYGLAKSMDNIRTHLYGSKSADDIYKKTSIHQGLSRENFENKDKYSSTNIVNSQSDSTNRDKATQIDKNFLDSTNNSIFVICKDGIPLSYCNNKDKASKYILKAVWNEKSKQILENSDYNYNIVIEKPSLVYLCSSYKNWFITYDNILCEFSYYKIKYLNK